ncbi:hypothetical protein OKW43_008293 [Paraburkholderia sp. WC7.3g]
MVYTGESLDKPTVGIRTSESGFNNCHRHFPEMIKAVERGVLAAGALPVVFPMISLCEVFLSPTSLVYRNLMAMAVEEMIRAQPMDAVVTLGGCGKTVPAMLMGAISAERPADAMVVAGPMMTGRHRGERLGACTDCRRFWSNFRAGKSLGAGDQACGGAAGGHGGNVCGHGHGVDHGADRGNAGHDAARFGGDSGRARGSSAQLRRNRSTGCAHGPQWRTETGRDRDARVGAQCLARAARGFRFDQRRDSSGGDCWSYRTEDRLRRVQPAV